jgi:hypothetical protein
MSTLRHYRGDTATYTFDHTLDMGDITKVSLYVRDTIDGTLRVATNSDDHAAAWVIGADSITLTLDEPGGPAAATTTSVALTKYHTQFVYDVQVETAAETVTLQYGAFVLTGDVVTPTTDEDLPSAFRTDIVDALEAAAAPAAANPFATMAAFDAYYDAAAVDALLLGYALAAHTHAFADLTAKPTTLAGYGITDAAALVHTHDDRYYTEAEVTALLAGYLTQAAGDARYGQLGAANTWALAQTFSAQITATVSDAATNTISLVGDYRHNTSGTPTNGFGLQQVFRAQTSTAADTSAVIEAYYWVNATHASRTSRWLLQTVYNAGSLTSTLAGGRTGAADSTALWLYDETAASLKQVTRGAADSGGAGFRLLRVAN